MYLISGLGADSRVFDFLSFDHCDVRYITWTAPEHTETLSAYARRLLEQITVERPVLIGVSFGGMIAIEIAKLVNTEKVILISSVKTRFDIPFYLRVAGFLRLHRHLPVALFKMVTPLTYWFFGTKSKWERELLKAIITETDTQFLKWAIACILTWDNERVLGNLIHIHGSSDRILPFRTADFKIIGGGHLMIVDQAEKITKILKATIPESDDRNSGS